MAMQFPDIQQSGRMPLPHFKQPIWTAIGEGNLLLGVTGVCHVHSDRRCPISSWRLCRPCVRNWDVCCWRDLYAVGGALSPSRNDHLLLAVSLVHWDGGNRSASMSSPIANAQFLRRVFGCFILTTAIAGVALSYAVLAVTFTPPTSTLALLLPG
jgi:hypothetical protein